MPKYLTKEKYEKLKKELEYLKTEKRKEIAKLLKHAASFGDLSENFAYQQAKEEQAFLEGRIKELEAILAQAKIIENKKKDTVQIGSIVYLREIKKGAKTEKYQIVDPVEADPFENKISFKSPLGKELLGKKSGEKVELKIDSGKIRYLIVKIE